MKITKIEPQKKRKDRYNVFADDQFCCGLSQDTIIDSALEVGQEISQKEIDELIDKDQSSKAFDKAIRFLGYRVRTEKEIRDKLKEKEFDKKVIEKTIKKLKKMDYISDSGFVESWVSDRVSVKPEGKRLIAAELRQKGVDQKIIDQKLPKLITSKTETRLAKKVYEKALKKYGNLPKFEQNKKITAYLMRRGFDWETINKIRNRFTF